MGNDWDWTLYVDRTPEVVAELFDLAVGAGLRIGHPEDGLISAFRTDEPGEFDRLDRDDLVAALASGTHHGCTLWPADEEVWFSVQESRLYWSIERFLFTPDLHRRLTDLWTVAAERFGARFGTVVDEWSWEQVWRVRGGELDFENPPPPGSFPDCFGWWTYFDAERAARLPEFPAAVAARVRSTASGGVVVALLEDPVDARDFVFGEIHRVLFGLAPEDGA
ncbi:MULTISPECIES: hypothetical protein [Actinosynnema]|uniref:hypothetical protein n=1 Tax=Actinosynnema TaxID=40566 RepID=UPI0020A2CEF9|nr:hypothetical protein [Actinosynnema pretiosum]MCP2098857.1 hypothetical protein [Actinosynnema pretiosum]